MNIHETSSGNQWHIKTSVRSREIYLLLICSRAHLAYDMLQCKLIEMSEIHDD